MIARRIKDAIANLHADAKVLDDAMSRRAGGPLELSAQELAAVAETQKILAHCVSNELDWRMLDDNHH